MRTAVFPNSTIQYNNTMTMSGVEVNHLLNNLPGIVYRGYHDDQRTLLFVSEGCVDLTGYTSDELELNNLISFADLVHSDDRSAVWQEIDRAIQAQRPYRCIYRLGTAAGYTQWVLDRGEARLTADGYLLEGFITDHTERVTFLQLLEQRVADRTRKLSALYEIVDIASRPASLPVIITHILGHILTAVKAEFGMIHLHDKDSPRLQLIAQQGVLPTTTYQPNTVNIAEDNFIGKVWQRKKPLIESDFQLDEWPSGAYIGIPIIHNNKSHGVLSLFTSEPDSFYSQGEMDLLLSVGEQIGGVIENTYLREQAEKLMVADERNRLARALHDSVTQSLYSVTLFAEAGRNLAESGAYDRASQYFDDVLQTGQQALKEMRLLVHNLRPSALEQDGLEHALQHRLNAVEGRAGIRHQLQVEDSLALTADLEEALYHISQEILNNSIKHAFASEVTVHLHQTDDEQVILKISDNGQGFEPQTTVTSGGLGLTSIRERVALLGGTVIYQSAPEQGTTVIVCVPKTVKRKK